LRAIAVGGSARSLSLPDVPTVAESGYPDFFAGTWYGLMVPKGTPAAVIDKLNVAVHRVVVSPEVKESIVHQGAEPKATSAAEMGKFVRAEYERAGRMVRLAGVTAE
jgi:tripartite-type tricarboxylate transporter receptor subunit TctC